MPLPPMETKARANDLDERLLREAKSAACAKTDTDTARLGLEA